MMNATSSFGQRIGIIDVVTRQETANTYLLTVRTFSEHEIKLSLIKSDGTLFLERFVGPKGILQYRLPVGTYQVIAADISGNSCRLST